MQLARGRPLRFYLNPFADPNLKSYEYPGIYSNIFLDLPSTYLIYILLPI